MRFVIFLVLCIMSFSLFCLGFEAANSIYYKYVLIEDFDNFPPDLQSWSSWDIEPDAWNFTHDFGYNGSSNPQEIRYASVFVMISMCCSIRLQEMNCSI